MPRLRVILADDDVLLREGIASLLDQAGLEVVAQAGDGAELLRLVGAHAPDLVIVDIRMPPRFEVEGLKVAKEIRARFPDVAVLVLSAHAEIEQAVELLAAGRGTGYLLKNRVIDVEEFVDTVRRIAAGSSVVDPALVQELIAARRSEAPLGELSAREREVLQLMAQGRSNAGIAHALWVTEGTVEKHVHSILAKLPLPSSADDHRRVLAVLAYLQAV